MLSFLVEHSVKNDKIKNDIMRVSFFVFNGIIGSILVSDLIRLLYGTIPEKPYIEYGIATGIAVSPYIYNKFTLMDNKTNNIALALGMFAGSILCDISEEKGRKEKREKEEKERKQGIGKHRNYKKEALHQLIKSHKHLPEKDKQILLEEELKKLEKEDKGKEKTRQEKINERRRSRYEVWG